LLTSDEPFKATSRTFTLSGDGTFGQFIPGINHLAVPSEPPVLMQLTQNAGFRTNLGLVNLSGEAVTITVDLFSADTTPLGSSDYSVEPYGHRQIDGFITGITGQPVDDGYAVIESAAPLRPFCAYASVIDTTTGDPMFIRPIVSSHDPLWIPAVAHVTGTNDAAWRTDLEVCSVGSENVRFRAELLETGRDNSDPQAATFNLQAGSCARYRDVVRSVFGRAGTGALRITAETGTVAASSRTYTESATGGTYGQYVAAVSGLGAYYSDLFQLAQSVDGGRGFRTNVGLVNTTPQPITVTLEIQTHDRTTLHQVVAELEPFEHRQLNRVMRGLTGYDLANARIEVSSRTNDERFFAYASVVDNVTGDAVYIPGM
jgi:hypothetical protein